MLCFGFRRKHTEQCSIEPEGISASHTVMPARRLVLAKGGGGGEHEVLEADRNRTVAQTG